MSKLAELIAELCPDGVEYKKIKDVYKRLRGTPITAEKMKEIENPDGEIRIFAGGKTVINAMEDDIPKANITRVPAVLVQSRGVIDGVYYDKPFTFKNEMWAYTTENITAVKYLYYVLKNNIPHFREAASGMGSLPQISLPVTEEFVIPVPPLQVQSEIVRILDNFTELIAELTAELTVELITRKKQYEYYSNQVFLKAGESSGWKSVGDVIMSLKTGLNPRQNFKLNVGGSLPYITGKDIFGNRINVTERTDKISEDALCLINKRAQLENGDVLFASTGTGTVGRMAVIEDYQNNWGISETLYTMKTKSDIINPLYLMYALYSPSSKNQFEPKISKGSVPHLKVEDLLKVSIPVPSINEQMQMVSLVKRFDTLCNDISTGLPSEIEARQKQYEYYRDKLLTFKELS